jgi:ASC-1-like (ASCH) protein
LQIENKNQAKKIEFHQELFEAAVNDINRLNNNDALIEENFNMLFANDKNLDERVNILYKYLGSD